jgi:hypothetical protein
MLLFFRMGFLLTNEFDFDNLALLEWAVLWFKVEAPVCNGP